MSATFFCNKCGAANDANAQFCSRCGTPFNPAAGSSPGAIPTPPPGTFPPAAPAAAGYAAQPAYAPGHPGVGVRYGGFWIRFLAFIIDAVIVRVVLIPFHAIFGLGGLALGGFGAGAWGGFHHGLGLPFLIFGGGVLALLTICANWLYETLMESSSYQATLGKMIFGMKVTDLYGNRIDFLRATGRHFAKIISGLILCIGFFMIGFTERKQGLHDMIAGTLVPRS